MRYSTQKTIQYVALGLGGLAIVGAGAIGVAYALMKDKKKTPVNHSVGVQQDFDFSYIDPSNVKHEIPGLKISQFETLMPNGEYEYFLDKEGISYLVKRFFETGNYGPEIFNLKKIWIANTNFTSSQENGVYIGATDEIGLNAENFAASLAKASPSAYGNPYDSAFKQLYSVPWANENVYSNQKIRAELLFQTLIHEYGHHLAHSYVSSPFNPSKVGDYTNVFMKADDGSDITNRFNKTFLATFKDSFKYNDDVKLINDKSSDFTNASNPPQLTTSIGSIYSTKNLWDIANNQGHTSPIDWKAQGYDHLGFNYFNYFRKPNEGGSSWDPTRTSYSYSYLYAQKDETLDYLYSAEELLTRKELLSSTTLDRDTFDALVRNRVKFDVLDDEYKYETPAMAKENSRGVAVANIIIDSTPRAGIFLKDSPFVATSQNDPTLVAKSYIETLNKYIGHADGDDISYIWQENNFKVVGKGEAGLEGELNLNKIKFGGYIDKDTYNSVGYFTEGPNGEQVWNEVSPISVEKFAFGYKDTLFASTRHEVEGSEKFFYATQNFIDKSKVLNRELHFAQLDENKQIVESAALTTFRTGDYGTASNYQEMLPSKLRSTNYVIPVTSNGKIALRGITIPGAWGGQ